MTDGGFIVASKPPLMWRIWRKLGFQFHLGEDEPKEPWSGWMQTKSGLRLDWRDRLRVLISGKIDLTHTYHLDVPSPNRHHTRFDWHILPPGGSS